MSKVKVKEKKLPEKLSDCVKVALADLAKIEKLKKSYIIAMESSFHDPMGSFGNKANKCVVCFAGAVMSQTLNTPLEDDVAPQNFSNYNGKRLHALDNLRQGSISSAIQEVYGIDNILPKYTDFNVSVKSYSEDKSKFKSDMKNVEKLLRKLGC